MTSQKKLELYKSIFQGRNDIYPRCWEKNGKSGWSPAYSFDWSEFNTHRATGGTIKNFENKTLQPLTDTILNNHLSGKETIGIYPILEHLKQDHKILLLTERKEHIEVLSLYLRNHTEVTTISGDD